MPRCQTLVWQRDNLKWHKANIPFVRFADDFLLFYSTPTEAEKALEFTKNQLDSLGLTIHPQKSRIVRSHRSALFLGERLPKPFH